MLPRWYAAPGNKGTRGGVKDVFRILMMQTIEERLESKGVAGYHFHDSEVVFIHKKVCATKFAAYNGSNIPTLFIN